MLHAATATSPRPIAHTRRLATKNSAGRTLWNGKGEGRACEHSYDNYPAQAARREVASRATGRGGSLLRGGWV
jgi:hypothetical protein